MDRLEELENKSIYIIREAHKTLGDIALLWSIGKDSSTLVWLARKAFFGELPFPVLHIDTGYKFPEIYAFRDEYVKKWGLNLIVAQNEDAIAAGMGPTNKLECCNALKTEALKQAIDRYGFKGLLLAIRRDEHGVRAKERYFSPRDSAFQWNYEEQPPELWDYYNASVGKDEHVRVHPLLDWTELDVWSYVKREKIPIVDLYLARDGQRYRSIGCLTCCDPVQSDAANVDEIIEELKNTSVGERSGRAQDKESAGTMQKLRALGYM